jgi:hydrophobic/amphiphilic exporter-1 (mainly G- bacteria), HAE1 family
MRDIVVTLVIAIVLVVYLFLQGLRATLIPLLAVPVSLIGTFVFFAAFGFSINTLSLFGLVLAIGLVVDDAIVVVEAVERHIEERMAPKEAALKAMQEISGPVIGIALVLSAMFAPTAFIPGITGRLYQQFAVTIAISVILSAFNALTLSPALAALLLRPKKVRGPEGNGLLQRFNAFNRVFGRATDGYVRWSGALIRKSPVALVMLAAAGVAGVFFAGKVPSSFLPNEDQGYMFLHLQLPNAASIERTEEVSSKIENILASTPGVNTVAGFSLLSFVRTTYSGLFFVTLKDWGERKKPEEQYQQILQHVNSELAKPPDGFALSWSARSRHLKNAGRVAIVDCIQPTRLSFHKLQHNRNSA